MYFNECVRKLIAVRYFCQPKLASGSKYEAYLHIQSTSVSGWFLVGKQTEDIRHVSKTLSRLVPSHSQPCPSPQQTPQPFLGVCGMKTWGLSPSWPLSWGFLQKCHVGRKTLQLPSDTACALISRQSKGCQLACLRRPILPPTDVFLSEGGSEERWGWSTLPVCHCPTVLLLTTIREWGHWDLSWEQELAPS